MATPEVQKAMDEYKDARKSARLANQRLTKAMDELLKAMRKK